VIAPLPEAAAITRWPGTEKGLGRQEATEALNVQVRCWSAKRLLVLFHLLSGRVGIVRGARRRRELWSDRAEVRSSYASKKIFAGWDPDVLDDYVDSGMVDLKQGGVRLRYPKECEARTFSAAPHNLWPELRKVSIPTLFVQGEHSDTFLDAARARVEREVPGSRTTVVPDSSHFVPMERPRELARVIEEFLEEKGL